MISLMLIWVICPASSATVSSRSMEVTRSLNRPANHARWWRAVVLVSNRVDAMWAQGPTEDGLGHRGCMLHVS